MGDSLDYITEYLKNPIKVGVYNCKVQIDLRAFNKLVEYVIKRCEKSEITRVKGHLKLDLAFSMMDILDKLSFALNELREQEKLPRKVSEFLDECMSGRCEKRSLYEEIFGEEYPIEIIESLILRDHLDVVSIDLIRPVEEELKLRIFGRVDDLDPLILELTSIKEVGVNLFLQFLDLIPRIGKKVQPTEPIQHTFSSRYSFRPYPLAVRLWLQKDGQISVPRDLHDFIDKASVYHLSKEWRTSIVLSAISVESLLADLYEDSYHEPSPEKATLGELYENVKKKVNFPILHCR